MKNKIEDVLFYLIVLLFSFTVLASIYLGAILQESYKLQPLTSAETAAERSK